MQDKWNVRGKKKKGYLKIRVALCVNINTKEILALEVTDEKVHADGKVIDQLVEQVLENNHNVKIVFAMRWRSLR